jgi:ribonucleoside-diphosphate reductase alpha chain
MKRKDVAIKIEYITEKMDVFDITVEDNHNFFANNILVHNCAEIYLSTKSPTSIGSALVHDLSSNNITLKEESDPGLIALCNLSSINLITWKDLSQEERAKTAINLLRASDNLIDYAYYPSKEGELFNRNYRAVGVGVTNYTQFLASLGFGFNSPESLKITNDIMESIYWHLMVANIALAQERGRFTWFDNTKYKLGQFTFDNYCGPYNFELNYDWEFLRQELVRCGARFATLMAIAPTATSSLIMKSSEGTEPIRKFVSMKTGTYNCKQLAPNLNKYRMVYESAWDISPQSMIDLASVRQRWVDQGQSFSLYYKDRNESASEILSDIIYSEKMGLKGLYYAHTPQDDEEEDVCVSCAV